MSLWKKSKPSKDIILLDNGHTAHGWQEAAAYYKREVDQSQKSLVTLENEVRELRAFKHGHELAEATAKRDAWIADDEVTQAYDASILARQKGIGSVPSVELQQELDGIKELQATRERHVNQHGPRLPNAEAWISVDANERAWNYMRRNGLA